MQATELRRQAPVGVETIGCDLADAGARERLVNNAGFGSAGLFTALDREGEVEMIRVNAEAVWTCDQTRDKSQEGRSRARPS